ncbi:PREDICTED: uncharacterized protein LOC109180568 isoform X2 [Ipomoea nil]|uniref:uncharacterized protein LOC109180568 isoform X2 n=1 Tax=Ipomoea nil TaxID=35883 RepID=UPI000901D117|nr:PREDICTED: uncharacterized protein LOC109180568 isoform X2 [Ipomoea nil]
MPSTQASTILQMWRELEGERVVSNPVARYVDRDGQLRSEGSNPDSVISFELDGQGSVNGNDSVEDANETENEYGAYEQIVLENEHHDGTSVVSDQSTDFTEIERERVRQVFKEWKNNGGVKSHSMNNTIHINNQSRAAEWLGENECERVRVVREWVQLNIQQRGTNASHRDERCAEIGSQIEQVRDGMPVNRSETGERRGLRRLCGRQALLDLLLKAQRQRKKELQWLMERKPVSDFAYRNRIQSLLRGRFLRNERSILDEKPASVAASELGVLRQRQTVSDLREGFLSKLDDGSNCQVNSSQSNGCPNADHDDFETIESQSNNGPDVIDECYYQDKLAADKGGEINGSHTVGNSEVEIVAELNQLEALVQTVETSEQILEYEGHVQETSNFQCNGTVHDQEHESIQNSGEDDLNEGSQGIVAEEDSEGQGLHSHEISDQYDAPNEINDVHEVHGVDGLERNSIDDFGWQGIVTPAEESQELVTEHEDTNLQQLSTEEFREWSEGAQEDTSGDWEESVADQWYQESQENDVEEQSHVQESHNEWHDNDGLQEEIDDWLDEHSTHNAAPVRSVDAFYIPDDDNVYSMELRELLSRRRVSNLLQSGFRESLDQLIQSYVERQGHASFDWEINGTSSSPGDIEQDHQQDNGNEDEDELNGIERDRLDMTSPDSLSLPIWEQGLPDSNLFHHTPHQHPGMEWEIINDFRINMVRLHQRMDNMQRMLEACMEMQVELQRSVWQEVSAALNRFAPKIDADVCDDVHLNDVSKWDKVRKGICCLCCNSNIDSLLYRCGHMCTCSKCAEKLVQGQGKCPMCRAPVVEVIRAYCIQ